MRTPVSAVALLIAAVHFTSLDAQQLRSGSAKGAVVESSGAPLPTAAVLLIPGSERRQTDERESFSFDSASPGRYVLEAQHVGNSSARVAVTVAAGTVETVMIRMGQQTTRLERVVVTRRDGRPRQEATSDVRGRK
jgi:hypothetical protein